MRSISKQTRVALDEALSGTVRPTSGSAARNRVGHKLLQENADGRQLLFRGTKVDRGHSRLYTCRYGAAYEFGYVSSWAPNAALLQNQKNPSCLCSVSSTLMQQPMRTVQRCCRPIRVHKRDMAPIHTYLVRPKHAIRSTHSTDQTRKAKLNMRTK